MWPCVNVALCQCGLVTVWPCVCVALCHVALWHVALCHVVCEPARVPFLYTFSDNSSSKYYSAESVVGQSLLS